MAQLVLQNERKDEMNRDMSSRLSILSKSLFVQTIPSTDSFLLPTQMVAVNLPPRRSISRNKYRN